MVRLSLGISLVMVVILLATKSSHLWPGTFFFLVQLVLISLVGLLTRYIRRKRRMLSLIPVLELFKKFFSVMFPLWIGLALIDRLNELAGRVFILIFFIRFFLPCQ